MANATTPELAHLRNRIAILENDMTTMQSEFQTLLNTIKNGYVAKSTQVANHNSNLHAIADLQRQIRKVSEKMNNILIPEETRAYLSLKEINTIKSGWAETQAKIAEMNNLSVALMSMIAKLEADWGSSKINFTG